MDRCNPHLNSLNYEALEDIWNIKVSVYKTVGSPEAINRE